MNQKKYTKQWLFLKKFKKTSNNYAEVLELFPTNVFELSFWCDLMFLAKLKQNDTPQQAIFYLYDRSFQKILACLPDNNKTLMNYKIELLQLVLGMSLNEGFNSLRQGLQECLIISSTYDSSQMKNKNINNKIICEHLLKKTTFTLEFIAEEIAEFIAKQNISQNISKKNLAQFDDISMVNIFIKHLEPTECIHNSRRSISNKYTKNTIKEFIVTHKKIRVVSSMKELIFKQANKEQIQFIIEIAYQLNLIDNIFSYISILSNNSLKNGKNDSEILYAINSSQLQQSNFKHMNYLQKFMMKYLASRPIALYSIIKLNINFPNTHSSISQTLQTHNNYIYYMIQQSPYQISKQCLNYYLQKSKFKNPYKKKLLSIKSTNQKHIPQLFDQEQVVDPFLFLPILKQFWMHSYHKSVLGMILWICIEHWLLFVQYKTNQIDKNNAANFEEYKKNLSLTFFQFACSFGRSKFVDYFPIQNGLVTDICYLPNFSSLMLDIQNFYSILWVNNLINTEFKSILKQKRGVQLIYQFVKKKKDSLERPFAQFLATYVDSQIRRSQQKTKSSFNVFLTKIVEQMSQSWEYGQMFLAIG